mmetsp:Transcript_8870/g.15098  ORF Transcript_8870/g.15098 Transcript_8870/m.15098 type:complete len:712 (-) Transcript_8870:258-2393(-)
MGPSLYTHGHGDLCGVSPPSTASFPPSSQNNNKTLSLMDLFNNAAHISSRNHTQCSLFSLGQVVFVERVEPILVHLDHVGLAHAQFWGQHLILRAEGLRDQHPLLGLLVLLDAALVELFWDLHFQQLHHARVLAQLLGLVPVSDAQLLRYHGKVRHHGGHVVRLARPVQHRLVHELAHGERVLDGRGGHVLAVLELVLLLAAPRDLDVLQPRPHHGHQVPRAKPALPTHGVHHNHFRGGLRLAPVPRHHVRSAHPQLPLRPRAHLHPHRAQVRFVQAPRVHHAELAFGDRGPASAQHAVPRVGVRDGHHRARFRQAVALRHAHAQGLDEVHHRDGGGRAGHDSDLQVAAQQVPHLRQHGLVQEAVLQAQQKAGFCPAPLALLHLVAHFERARHEKTLHGGGLLLDLLVHAVKHLFEQGGHAEEHRGLHLLDVGQQLGRVPWSPRSDARTRPQREAAVELAQLPVRVRPRQKRQAPVVPGDHLLLASVIHHLPHVAAQVVVRQHHPFRLPRSARRVDERRQIFGLRSAPFFVVVVGGGGCCSFALLHHVRKRLGVGLVKVAAHYLLHRGPQLALRVELRHLFKDGHGRHDKHLRFRVLHDVLPVCALLLLVHGHVHRPQPVAPVGGQHPLDAVARDDRYRVAPLHTQHVLERVPKSVHLLLHLTVLEKRKNAILFDSECLAVGISRARSLHELVQSGERGQQPLRRGWVNLC